MSRFWRNILLIVGTTVGAGIFSLPQILHSIGLVWYLLFLLVFAYVMYRVNWFYYQVIDQVQGKHQLSGYVERVIGKKWGSVAVILHVLSTYGALVAFVYIGGEFLGTAIGVEPNLGSQLFFVLSFVMLFFAGNKIENIDISFSIIKGVMFIVIAGVCILSIEQWNGLQLTTTSLPFTTFGSIIFAFTGLSIIPELHKGKIEGKSILAAQVLILCVYLLFTLALLPFWNGTEFIFKNIVIEKAFTITGFISVFTAYLLLSWVGKDIFQEDLHLKPKLAFGLVCFIPLAAVVFHFGTFLSILSITGSLFLGGIGLLICWMYRSVFPERHRIEVVIIQLLFIGVMVGELVNVVYSF